VQLQRAAEGDGGSGQVSAAPPVGAPPARTSDDDASPDGQPYDGEGDGAPHRGRPVPVGGRSDDAGTSMLSRGGSHGGVPVPTRGRRLRRGRREGA
jgi:hypothetical protein